MKRLLPILLGLCLLLTGLPVVATEPTPDLGHVLESAHIKIHTTAEIDRMIRGFYEPEQVLPAGFAVDEYRVRFASVYRDGEPIEVVAQLYVPRVENAAEFPVFVMGAGSTGLADQCAPSLEKPAEQNWGSYRLFLLTMAAQGYITIMPDYAGFNDPDRIQPYYVAEMAGRVMLDAGRAVYDWFAQSPQAEDAGPVTPLDAVFVSGYSQGGQSVFAAKDLWASYAPDLPLKGVVAYASVTNMASHMQTLPQLAPYRMYAWADYYGEDQVDWRQVFSDRWLPTLEEDVLRMCVFDAAGYFSADPTELYRPEFLEALRGGTLAESYPTIGELLELNSPGFVQNDIPALIVQGTEDRTVPMAVHEQFVERYCDAGNLLTEQLYEGMNHFHLRETSYRNVLDWMAGVTSGEVPPNDCE